MRSQRGVRRARIAVGALGLLGAMGCESMMVSESSDLEVRDYECVGERCAVVVTVPDTEPDSGRSIPAPIDATNRFLRIIHAGEADRRALFSVAPLDAIANTGDMATVRGTYFAASVHTAAATTFRGALGREPLRWFVFGGGGRGSAAAGEPGEGAPPASGGASFAPGCAVDAFSVSCGGGAGGAGEDLAAEGGGSSAFVVLGTFDAAVVVDARGADGVGGGGGGGGRVFIGGSHATGDGITIDTSGGLGDARSGSRGGDGAAGEPTVDDDALSTPERWIVRDASLLITGFGPEGGRIEIQRLDGTPVGSAVVGLDGTFSVDVSLIAGLNRLRSFAITSDGARNRMWSGNHFELERRETQVLPVGGLLDVAYLP